MELIMNTSQTYVKILRWGIFISLFLPLIIFSQYISPFHFGKMVVFNGTKTRNFISRLWADFKRIHPSKSWFRSPCEP